MRKNIIVSLLSMLSLAAIADIKIERSKVTYLADQTFTEAVDMAGGMSFSGLSDVSGDALCLSGAGALGTCDAAVFTTSVSSPAIVSPLTGGSDNITLSPAGTLAMTVAETSGNMTLVGDAIISGGDVTALNLQSAATGSADNISLKPATVAVLNVNEAGDLLMAKVVTVHGACAALGDVGRIEIYNDGADHISFCGCEQTAAATFAWKAFSSTGVC